ncbi:ROK family transcriptional regulator [soil metagenome]
MKKIYLHGAKDQIARHNTIRDINKQIVLNYVRARSPISRAEIARETSLQRSTVSAIVDDLVLEGMIEEIGTGDSTGGRKPTLLQLKTGTPIAIGVDITPRETTVVLADLGGNILQKDSFPTSSDIDYMNEQILAKVSAHAREYNQYNLEVGISIPGIADQLNGNILYIPYFQWTNWDIGQRITETTGLPVIIDNDANAVALAELWFGEETTRKTRNFIVVLISEGIGTGIIIDGQVYRGEDGAAGEFGHMYVGDNAPVNCSCGRRDCWEAHASEKAIINRYGPGNGVIDIERFIGLAQNGEKQALSVMKETAGYLGIGISNLIVGFSPEKIVLSGSLVKAWDMISDEINELARRSIRHELAGTAIVPSALGDNPTIMGSISLVLSRKFASAN